MFKMLKLFIFIFVLTIVSTNLMSGTLLDGKALYERKCDRCHMLVKPQKHSIEEWKTIFKDMGPLSGLNETTEKAMLTYLEENSSKTSSGLPTAPVLGGYLYTEFWSGKDRTDTFDMHYLNFNVSGRLHERVSYKAEFELEHGGKGDNTFVEQAFLDFWVTRNMAIRIGAFLAPFNRFDDFHGPIENLMVTRPQMSREIGVSA